MLINIWSTPRTGSNWLSFFLKNKFSKIYKNVVFLSEPFNIYHHRMYYELKPNGELVNHREYSTGFFWIDYKLDNEKNIIAEKRFEPNHSDWNIVVQNRKSLILEKNPQNTIIMHNHVSPLEESLFFQLANRASINYYTHRLNKCDQLASYALAYHTKNFIKFSGIASEQSYANIVDTKVLENLCIRIKESEERISRVSKCLQVAYEELSFIEFPHSPVKQFKNSWAQLQNADQGIIESLISKYGLKSWAH